MPLVGSWEKSAEISGPVCPNGGHMRAAVQVASEPGKVVITASANCTNHCLTDNLEPSVAIDVVDDANNVVAALALDIPVVPGKGWPWNGSPVRQTGTALELHTSIRIKEIRFHFRNRAHASAFTDVINLATSILAQVL